MKFHLLISYIRTSQKRMPKLKLFRSNTRVLGGDRAHSEEQLTTSLVPYLWSYEPVNFCHRSIMFETKNTKLLPFENVEVYVKCELQGPSLHLVVTARVYGETVFSFDKSHTEPYHLKQAASLFFHYNQLYEVFLLEAKRKQLVPFEATILPNKVIFRDSQACALVEYDTNIPRLACAKEEDRLEEKIKYILKPPPCSAFSVINIYKFVYYYIDLLTVFMARCGVMLANDVASEELDRVFSVVRLKQFLQEAHWMYSKILVPIASNKNSF